MRSRELYYIAGFVLALGMLGSHPVLAAETASSPFKPKKAKNFYNFSVRAEKNPGTAKYNGSTEKAPLCAPDLVITNGAGQRVGIDATTGNEVREIPRGSYLRDGNWGTTKLSRGAISVAAIIWNLRPWVSLRPNLRPVLRRVSSHREPRFSIKSPCGDPPPARTWTSNG
jgi:hypothetical protein